MGLTRILSAQDISDLIDIVGLGELMDSAIDRLREAFTNFKAETFVLPVRAGFTYASPHTGLIEWMPVMERGRCATLKLVGYHPENPHVYQLPTVVSTVSLYDVTTGHLKALADATFLTALRTGAASAIANHMLAPARPGR